MALEKQSTVKQRAVRIPLDYFQHKTGIDRWKGMLALIAAAAGLGYVAWCIMSRGGPSHFSPGPLATVHSMWNDRCEVCHQSFTPTSAGAWGRDPHAADTLCQACHRGDEHSSKQIAAEVVSCAACHSDHHGTNTDLTRIADSMCTNCHADIAAHLKSGATGTSPPLANVTSFITDHPDFRSAKRDPAQLKFSHSRHMRPGVTFGLNPLTLNDLAPADRPRYRQPGQADTDLITLNCTSCHQLDRSHTLTQTNGSAAGGLPAVAPSDIPVRPAGDYMLPISYELHCQACHQLTYAGRAKPTEAAPENAARHLVAQQNQSVPHGWTDEQLRTYLKQVLDTRFLNNPDHTLLNSPLQSAVEQPLDKWRLPNRPPKANELSQTVGDYLGDEFQAAVKSLRLQCIECHQMSPEADRLKVKPVSTRPVWFAYAKFNHAEHRAVNCESCHSGNFPSQLPAEATAIETLDGDKVPIPGRQICLQCHSSPSGTGADATGGARFDCVECHSYHHGDSPWHGPGDSAGAPAKRVSVKEFIDRGP